MGEADFGMLVAVTKRAAAALREADVPFVLAGGIASWARGGPPTEHDVDVAVRPRDAERAVEALVADGFTREEPPEEWLHKATVDGVTVDVIFGPSGLEVDDELFERADTLSVDAASMLVMTAEDILVSKVLALDDHHADFESVLEISRALREQIDWNSARARVDQSPFGAAFVVLAERLGLSRRD